MPGTGVEDKTGCAIMRRRRLNFNYAFIGHGIREQPETIAMNKATPPARQLADPATPASTSGSDKAFGLVFSVVFALVALYPLIAGAPIRLWAMGLAALFLVAAFAWPQSLSPLNRLWAKLGLVLHRLVSPLALFVVFGFTVLPTGLVLRIMGKDLLRLRFEPGAETYWIERKPPGRADQQMKKQF